MTVSTLFLQRVGRTARGATGSGRALLFLTPEETGFLRYLKAAKVSLNEYEFPSHKIANVQSQLQRLIEKNYYLNKAARDAYRSYLLGVCKSLAAGDFQRARA